MSPSICQGIQSCLESQIVEPKVTGLQLNPNVSHFSPSLIHVHVTPLTSDSDSGIEEREKANNYDMSNTKTNTKTNPSNGVFGTWSFLGNTLTMEAKPEEKGTLYVHPLAKRSLSKLSTKSLELCTENLGCETGSDIGDYNDISYSSSSDSENGKSPTREKLKLAQFSRKVNHRSFPPPLTSISNSDGVRFRPHREGGRLVIKAVTILPSQTCFEAERGDGRLRLRFINNYNTPNPENEDDDNEDDGEQEEEAEHEENEGGYLSDDITENNENVEGEMVNGEYQQIHCRCKEGGHVKAGGLLHWEPFLGVATT